MVVTKLNLLAVFVGGGLGSVARWSLSYVLTYQPLSSQLLAPYIQKEFPIGILVVNWLGCFLIGVLAGWLARVSNPAESESIRLLLMVGFLGGFTTFSTFSLEALQMMLKGQWAGLISYLLLSVGGGFVFTWIGYLLKPVN